LKNFLKDRNGNLIDQVILIKEIHEEWSDYWSSGYIPLNSPSAFFFPSAFS
jgi:hypothetical protein